MTLPTFYVKIPEQVLAEAMERREAPATVDYPSDPESVAKRARDNDRSIKTQSFDKEMAAV